MIGTFAVVLKTESGDEYLFLKQGVSERQMIEYIKCQMDDELGYVSDKYCEVINGDAALLTDLLNKAIEEAA